MHIWVDFFRLPLRKSGEAYHMTSPHWRVRRNTTWSFLVTEIGSGVHHVISPHHCGGELGTSRDDPHHCDGELDNEDEVWWTKPQAIWLTLGLKVDWHGLFQIWPGAKGWWLFLTSSFPSLLSGHSPSHWPQSFTAQLPFFTSEWKSLSSPLKAEKKKFESGGFSLAFASPAAHAP